MRKDTPHRKQEHQRHQSVPKLRHRRHHKALEPCLTRNGLSSRRKTPPTSLVASCTSSWHVCQQQKIYVLDVHRCAQLPVVETTIHKSLFGLWPHGHLAKHVIHEEQVDGTLEKTEAPSPMIEVAIVQPFASPRRPPQLPLLTAPSPCHA